MGAARLMLLLLPCLPVFLLHLPPHKISSWLNACAEVKLMLWPVYFAFPGFAADSAVTVTSAL